MRTRYTILTTNNKVVLQTIIEDDLKSENVPY